MSLDFRCLALAMVVSLVVPTPAHAQVAKLSRADAARLDTVRAILDTLRGRLGVGEAERLRRLNDLEIAALRDSIKRANDSWLRDTTRANLSVIVTVVGGVTGVLIALWRWTKDREAARTAAATAQITTRQAITRTTAFEALKWFEGDTQKRSLGIAAIEANRDDEELADLAVVWRNVLVGQAVYLLTESKQHRRVDEAVNLGRVIDLLTHWRGKLSDQQRYFLRVALSTARDNPGAGIGLGSDPKGLTVWAESVGVLPLEEPGAFTGLSFR